MNMNEAEKASRNGAIAAFIVGGFTAITFLIVTLSDLQTGPFSSLNDPFSIVDIGLIFICAFAMLRHSRVAAIIMVIYWTVSKIYIYWAFELEPVQGIASALGGLVFLYFFVKAIQGSFAYHKIKKAENADYRASPKWVYVAAIPVVGLLFIVFGYTLLVETGVAPPVEVIAGVDVTDKDRQMLVETGVLFEGEIIEYFYSWGVVTILEGGSILSDRAVIAYASDENFQVQAFELPFSDISYIELVEEGDYFSDSIYKVYSNEPDFWILIALSKQNSGDIKFIEALREKIALQSIIDSSI